MHGPRTGNVEHALIRLIPIMGIGRERDNYLVKFKPLGHRRGRDYYALSEKSAVLRQEIYVGVAKQTGRCLRQRWRLANDSQHPMRGGPKS